MRTPTCLLPPPDSIWAPPLDVLDVAVRLETGGVTDRVACDDYGYDNTIALATACYPALSTTEPSGAANPAPLSVFGEYLKGVSFGFPLLLCALAMFFFRFSLWGGDVTAEVAAAVGAGTISSFVVTGGFVQAMGRRCTFLLHALEGRGAAHLCRRWVCRAGVALLASALIVTAGSLYLRLFPLRLTGILVAFHLALGTLWIAAGVLHTLERTRMILSACAIGLVTVIACHLGAGFPLLPAQIVGILVAAACAFQSARRTLEEYPLASSPLQETSSLEAYVTWPYFTFGLLYYFFLFLDRLLAWTVPDLSAPLAIVFRGDYETGLDIALIAFVLAAGAVRPAIVFFFQHLQTNLKTTGLSGRTEFCALMRRAFKRSSGLLAGGCFMISAAVGIVASLLVEPGNAQVVHILWGSLLAVPSLVIGLWNTNLLFRLSRPCDALLSIGPAILADLVTGYVLTRISGYAFGVAGFALGALIFATFSGVLANRRLQQLDFENYGSAV